ncbi:MAG: MBL fold metallo-hydrolase [Saprospiraceae bacterium]|nr:MBL fold metallo-hydrolase [Saprospiraceae bacterium]
MRKRSYYLSVIIFLFTLLLCNGQSIETPGTRLVILGTCQDAGSPHIDCSKNCCINLSIEEKEKRKVVSLGIIDDKSRKTYLFEATPDMTSQLASLSDMSGFKTNMLPDAIFLTHAHIGHYTGLMYLGKEAKNSKEIPVYTMPGMKTFLQDNGPWSQLVSDKNIALNKLLHNQETTISNDFKVIPFLVPHRDEYSETVGYKIIGPGKSVLFIPDIDKWGKWSRDIIEEIKKVDLAFIDATFYSASEIGYRDISLIPHPFVIETIEKFKDQSLSLRNKIYFIHLNHTNPLLNKTSKEYMEVIQNGFNVAEIYSVFSLD